MKYTHGGLPEDQAKHWDKETYQELGRIVVKLATGTAIEQHEAQKDYWRLKRYFMAEEFDTLINRLDEYRVERGFTPIGIMIDNVAEQIVANKKVVEPNETLPDIPKSFEFEYVDVKPFGEAVEQMSLF
jgi:hypothetical protein